MRWWLLWLVLTATALARPLHFPYQEAGLTRQEAAAHLLNRLAYGPRPHQVEEVARQGLEEWFETQLKGLPPDPRLEALLAAVPERSEPGSLVSRKLLRAVYSPNQVQEVMTDFWFNHFNVSLTDDDCRAYVAGYEREAIAPNALGTFRTLLGATAHHPCMLYYLDNAYSRYDPNAAQAAAALPTRPDDPLGYGRRRHGDKRVETLTTRPRSGLNENYARELLELHTLGVDGGYRQADVTEVARVLTGWTVERTEKQASFVFNDQLHDPKPKTVLFSRIDPEGSKEGEKVLDLVANHTSTARFVGRKLAVRFFSDDPGPAALEVMVRAFQRSRGDTRAILTTMLESPEFWKSRRNKVKSPFELVASALRATGAELQSNNGAAWTLAQMGQDLYSCRPPTGWPDRADYWVSGTNMLMRMGFGHELASAMLPWARPDPTRYEGCSPTLAAYAEQILPGRDCQMTLQLLQDASQDPDYAQKVLEAAKRKGKAKIPAARAQKGVRPTDPATVANWVGLLLGSPEFQRR